MIERLLCRNLAGWRGDTPGEERVDGREFSSARRGPVGEGNRWRREGPVISSGPMQFRLAMSHGITHSTRWLPSRYPSRVVASISAAAERRHDRRPTSPRCGATARAGSARREHARPGATTSIVDVGVTAGSARDTAERSRQPRRAAPARGDHRPRLRARQGGRQLRPSATPPRPPADARHDLAAARGVAGARSAATLQALPCRSPSTDRAGLVRRNAGRAERARRRRDAAPRAFACPRRCRAGILCELSERARPRWVSGEQAVLDWRRRRKCAAERRPTAPGRADQYDTRIERLPFGP